MNVTGAHVAGGGIGAMLGIGLAALGKKIGLHMTTDEAASTSLQLAVVGVGVGHFLSKAWNGVGILPALRRGFLGPKR